MGWRSDLRCFSVCVFGTLLAPASLSGTANDQLRPANMTVSSNGRLARDSGRGDIRAESDNGRFWCSYTVSRVGDEVRELSNFQMFENGQLLYRLDSAPGSDLYVSNSGVVAFMDTRHHYRGEVQIHFYSRAGAKLFAETFRGAFVFGFSPAGNAFGVGTPEGLYVVTAAGRTVARYERGFQFAISENENLVAVAPENRVLVYAGGKMLRDIETGLPHTRAVQVSSHHKMVGVVGKRDLRVYSLPDGELLFADRISGWLSYRDLLFHEGRVLVGIHYRDDELSKGILRVYDRGGTMLVETEGSARAHPKPATPAHPPGSSSQYDHIPWPFEPFDSVHTVWNYYEQHMSYGGSDWSYLHQGLDIIVPIAEPTYAVADGIVKCVLTISAEYHWRIAVSKEQVPGYSTGWLYAHLIEETIQFDVGDTVHVHDYLGDIIEWAEDWGHIHFVEIRDSGLVWQYYDNEWGINYNPLLSLRPDTDTIPPVIESVFPASLLGFCLNETSTYLDPDSLYGDIDIIAKVVDYVGDSEWQQPAFQTYYWAKRLPEGTIVFPRTLGQILNHAYDFYASGHYEPYATLLYKRDDNLVPSFWMDRERNYYHILTNNNGDSVAVLSEKELAFATADYPNGSYRVFVEAVDEYGNSTIDSMDVQFKNSQLPVSGPSELEPLDLQLAFNQPNPFESKTTILYSLPGAGFVTLRVYDLVGREMECLVNGYQQAGAHSVIFRAGDVPSGVYLYELRTDDLTLKKKMTLAQ
jgi:hypothetical protein